MQRHSPLLVLNLGLDIVDGVRGLNLEGDGLTREAVKQVAVSTPPSDIAYNDMDSRLDENLHGCRRPCLSNELNDGVVDEKRLS